MKHPSMRSAFSFAANQAQGTGHSLHSTAMTASKTATASATPGDPGGAVVPFHLEVPQTVLDDLRERLARARWPDAATEPRWEQGTDLDYLRELVDYWRTDFDWRAQERRLNTLPHFKTVIDGLDVHFIHIRGRGSNPLPLVLTHGWPSSFAEFQKIIPLLTDPAATGGDPKDAFDVVVPSLPGYGFSARPRSPGMTTARIAALWARLMTEHLGYSRFCAHGGDIGAGVTNQLGLNHRDVLHGIHVMAVTPPWLGAGSVPLSAEEQEYQALLDAWKWDEGAYSHLQRTRPQTLAYGMHDSPIGLAAWIVEKLRAWSDCYGDIEKRFSKDELLTNILLYWVTETFGSSVRLYYDGTRYAKAAGPETKISTPTAIALTTEAVDRAPRRWAERTYTNIQRWTEFPRGGHFMAAEEPQLLAADLRSYFRQFR
jgi:pimeloyl-ACP methyl ester carboxylesterase